MAALEDRISRLEAQASAQRVFVQNAAHQLKTPLALLATQAVCAARAGDAATKDEAIAAMRRTLRRTARLLDQLLTLSAAESPGRAAPAAEAFQLDTLVQGVVEELSPLARSGAVDLGYAQRGDVPPLRGNPMAAREIALNLLDNAIRYCGPGGVVTAHVRAAAGQPGTRWELAVEDNGPGIAPAHREQVFQRFHRLDPTRGDGCDLGLPIVREFAARLGAAVSLATPDGGKGLLATVSFGALHAYDPPPRPGA